MLSGESIALKELLPVVLACAVWGEFWHEKVLHVHCDNLGWSIQAIARFLR